MTQFTVRTRLLHSGETYLPGSIVDLDATMASTLSLLGVVDPISVPAEPEPQPTTTKVTRKKAASTQAEPETEVADDAQADG